MMAELERMRAHLLDLSARNPLLNYTHPRARSLRVVDEVPALVLDRLVGNGGNGLKFAPLDIEQDEVGGRQNPWRRGRGGEATLFGSNADEDQASIGEASETGLLSQSDRARREAAKVARMRHEARIAERARESGIDPSYDLPAVGDSDEEQHGDNRLQTLLSPDELETRLQKIQASAVTAIQESGANMLHLLFGFVEWIDVTGGKTRVAPLVLLPVSLARLELDRATHTFPYVVSASGEDWDTNVTLQEKCRREFGFALPGVEAEENLEDYFARVEEVLATAAPKGWSLKRQLTLGLVSFGKILMWRDLDPKTWPKHQPLLANRLIRELLGSDAGAGDLDLGEDGAFAETRTTEYNVDRLPKEFGPVPPIVVPADSSQHSVLVDVQRGDTLVVQGPPGTGKSQTITNIIADAIAAGKKILFVAEKKAALEVVARRLAQAGLGPFCLPLHSHTSNKREFLDGLAERIALSAVPDPRRDIDQVSELLAETREVLTGHADRLHAEFGSLGDTAFTIFWRARRLASEMPESVIVALRGLQLPKAVEVTSGEHARMRALLADFSAAFAAMASDIPKGGAHPWHGITRDDLTFNAAEVLLALARDSHAALAATERARLELAATTQGVSWPDTTAALYPIISGAKPLSPPRAALPGGLIEAIHRRAGETAVRTAVEAADVARRAWAAIPGPWGLPGVLTCESLAAHRGALDAAIDLFGEARTVADAEAAGRSCEHARSRLRAAEALAARVAAALDLSVALTPNVATRLVAIARAAKALPNETLALRAPALATPNATERITSLRTRAEALGKERESFDARFAPEMRPPVAEIRQLAAALAEAPSILPGLFSRAYRRAAKQYRRMSGGRKADRAAMTREVGVLLRHLANLDAFLADPGLSQLFGPAADGLKSPFGSALALLEWTTEGTNSVRGLGESGRRIAMAVWSAPMDAWAEASAIAVADPIGSDAAAAVPTALSEASALVRDGSENLADALIPTLCETIVSWKSVAERATAVGAHAAADRSTLIAELRGRLVLVERAWAADKALANHETTFRELGLGLPTCSPGASDHDALSNVRLALEYLAQFHKCELPKDLIDWLAAGDPKNRVAKLRTAVAAYAARISALVQTEAKFVQAGGANHALWYGTPPAQTPLSDRQRRYEHAIEGAGTLARLVTCLRMRGAVLRSAMPQAAKLLEAGAVSGKQLPDAYSYFLTRTLAELVLRERPELDEFSGDLHERRRAQFAALDAALIELTQKGIAHRASQAPRVRGIGFGPVKDLTEQSLIEHEIGKTRRHVPIREVFRRAGLAIQMLKPCIMMGPQAVAQYLPPGLFHFDLVVMDEASQMRPQDALGAIARGSQLVVVGDPKQLGPTSFFDAQASEEDEVDEAAAQLAAQASGVEEIPRGASVLERSESILLGAACRYPMRMLKWHYRSRYPQLISFSNQEFYGGGLILFPHPGTERTGDGVNFRAVENALYSSGINRREAEVIADAVRDHAAKHAERTLLVVTMNQAQREVVDALIQQAEKDDPQLAAFRARHEQTLEPFGVKNLENVQGDERDVIFVSATYGPNDRGTVVQNFGPVNTAGGERRLNVLFTRAKYRLDVFCSFDPSALRVTEDSPRGLCVFRDYLRYAKEGTLAGGRFTGREPDSDFEIEVARAVRAHGFDVHAQIGVAGYFLDMAVVDPKHPGRYLLAIECDGATYHSAKSARDRDRLRQGVLESLGWTVHRIWSTDWFRDHQGETAKVLGAITRLMA
jgi:very-short-patch-repair endonuclease